MAKIIEDKVRYLLFFAILSLPLGVILRIDLRNNIFLIPNDLIISAISIFVVLLFFLRKDFKNLYLMKPIFIFVFIGIISLIVNYYKFEQMQIFVGGLYLFRWFSYSSLYFLVANLSQKNKAIVVKIMIFSGALLVFVGLIQYTWYPNLRNLYYLGWDEHLNRLFSSFLDPNFAGAFFVLFLVLVYPKLYQAVKNKRHIVLWAILFISILISIFLTYSRSALLMLSSCFLVFLLLRIFIFKTNIRLIILSSITFLIIIAMGVFLAPKSFQTENTNLLRTTSSNQRIDSLEKAITIISKNPVLGVGFNTYRYAQEKENFIKDKSSVNSGAGTDNSFLFAMATTGIVGLLCYLFLIAKIFTLGFKNIRKNIYAPLLVVSLFGLSIDSLFINSLFYIFFMEWIWILAGLTENK